MNTCSDMNGYYEVLQVDDTASHDAIKKSYRNLARIYHPDKEHGDEDKFKKLQEAYDTLSNKEKRSLYDRNLDEHDGQHNFEHAFVFDMSDVFQNIFGNTTSSHPETRNDPPQTKPVHLSLDDVFFGCDKSIIYDKYVKCNKCGPDGKIHSSLIQCLNCHGKGYIESFTFPVICPSCNGESIIRTNLRDCPSCNGTIHLLKRLSLKIPIESGMKHNSTFALDSENMIIEFKYAFENKLKIKIHGYDVHLKHNITVEELLIGFSHRVILNQTDEPLELSRDKYFDIASPEVFRKRGVCKDKYLKDRGDLYVQYIVSGSDNPKQLHRFKKAFEKIFLIRSSNPPKPL